MRRKSKLSCKDHLDMAFDDFLLEEETYPNLLETKEGTCNYCDSTAVYILLKNENTKVESLKDIPSSLTKEESTKDSYEDKH